jgi:hypothetical protein
MKQVTDKKLIEFAQRLTWKNPTINVLRDDIKDQYSPLVQLIEGQLFEKNEKKKLLLPELRKDGNETIGIFSDYGGESNDSLYNTYTFLVCGWNHSFEFFNQMKGVRKKYKLEDKEFSFKDLRYGPIKRSLKDYLNTLDYCVIGLLYTVIIEKEVETLFVGKDETFNSMCKLVYDSGFGKWKPNVLEKLLRIVHTAAYLTALLSKNGQKIFWMTDHDAIAPNQSKTLDTLNIFCSILPFYTENSFKTIGWAVPFNERSTDTLDLLSAADLVAGAIEHYFTRNDKMDELSIKEEADTILQWLGHDGIGLKKQTLLVKKDGNGIKGSEIVFKQKVKPKDAQFIPIPM